MEAAKPDAFIFYEYPKLLDQSREAVAGLLHAPTDTVVFVSNTTMAINTVLRNLEWADDKLDEILHFNTIYGGCGKTVDYIVDSNHGRVSSRIVDLQYPIKDEEILTRFRTAIEDSRAEGKRPRICILDTVTSAPGVRFPFEAVTAECREAGILSLIDGAHGIGMIDLDLSNLDPDFFVSNCHKWLLVPRGCAVFYVPIRNQHLIRTTLPTSHRYVPKAGSSRRNPLPPSQNSAFVSMFEFVGTVDSAPYLCVKDVIEWRQRVLGGEEKIHTYILDLARQGGKEVAQILGTEVLKTSSGSLTDCAMVNIALPLVFEDVGELVGEGGAGYAADMKIPRKDEEQISEWMRQRSIHDYNTYFMFFTLGNRYWVRLSAQVYLSIQDFVWAGETLREFCGRIGKLEYLE
jgi:selenocysteine lyase/cysteine desulfurase